MPLPQGAEALRQARDEPSPPVPSPPQPAGRDRRAWTPPTPRCINGRLPPADPSTRRPRGTPLTPLLRLDGVTRHFGDVVAVDGLNLEVHPGEVFGLLGPNGAGKTTTVRLLCGLLPPTQGSLHIEGHDVQADPLQARRSLGYVPDGAPLYPALSPLQHLELVGRLHGLASDHLRSESQRLLEVLGLGDRSSDPVGTFSRGMRQKTALACAILHRPKLLILDEPLSGLDAPTAAMFKEVLRGWADRGGAVIYTSHLLDVVERVCDRMAILATGRLVAVGSLDELRQRAGSEGTLEQVFGTLAETADPAAQAAELLGP